MDIFNGYYNMGLDTYNGVMDTLRGLVSNWHRRAAVVNANYPIVFTEGEKTNHYPLAMLPFSEHPSFQSLSGEQKQQILLYAWIIYNSRVVLAENHIVNPAFSQLIQGNWLTKKHHCFLQQAVQQCLIDEQFHSWMHLLAIEHAKASVVGEMKLNVFPESKIYVNFCRACSIFPEHWQKQLLTLMWAVVSEVSINAYLSLLSEDLSINPTHRYIVWLHNRDEYTHSKVTIEAFKEVFINFTPKQKTFFIKQMPFVIESFSLRDDSAWLVILSSIGICDSRTILNDCASSTLVRDFSGIKKLLDELDIQIDSPLLTN